MKTQALRLILGIIFTLLFLSPVFGQIGDLSTSETWRYNGNNIYNVNSGYVGIGTTSPIAKLNIFSNIPYSNWTEGIQLTNQVDENTYNAYIAQRGPSGLQFKANGGFGFIDEITGSQYLMIIASNGEVGIGNMFDPLEKLDVDGAIRIGSTNNNNAGTIQWTGSDFQGFNGTDWISLSSNSLWDLSGNDIYYNTGNVGIGTTSPSEKLELNGGIFINSDIASTDIFKMATLSTENLPVVKIGVDNYKRANLTLGIWTEPQEGGDNLAGNIEDKIFFNAGGTSYLINNGGLAIGKTTVISGYSMDVNGKIRANEIVVNTGGADFVFEDKYNLKSLEEVENFIKENKHLPEIPSATEVQENGVSVGEMQTKLLQKIEELTLYLIDQNKSIQELKEENASLKKILNCEQ